MKTFSVTVVTATGDSLRLPVLHRSSVGAALSVLRTLAQPPRRLTSRLA